MAVSRNALEYLERKGLVNAAAWPPRPRLAVTDLLVNVLPAGKPDPTQEVLVQYEGVGGETPDRGAARPWPNQVSEYGEDL
jgi:hypothetical protein